MPSSYSVDSYRVKTGEGGKVALHSLIRMARGLRKNGVEDGEQVLILLFLDVKG